MAFEMKNIKRKIPSKKDDIKECYAYIQSNNILSENIKVALWKYVEFRVSKHQKGRLKGSTLENMVNELLANICSKNIKELTYYDVINNENDILYQIKRAIVFGATLNLYYDDSITDIQDLNFTFVRKPPERQMSIEETKDYFKDMII